VGEGELFLFLGGDFDLERDRERDLGGECPGDGGDGLRRRWRPRLCESVPFDFLSLEVAAAALAAKLESDTVEERRDESSERFLSFFLSDFAFELLLGSISIFSKLEDEEPKFVVRGDCVSSDIWISDALFFVSSS